MVYKRERLALRDRVRWLQNNTQTTAKFVRYIPQTYILFSQIKVNFKALQCQSEYVIYHVHKNETINGKKYINFKY